MALALYRDVVRKKGGKNVKFDDIYIIYLNEAADFQNDEDE